MIINTTEKLIFFLLLFLNINFIHCQSDFSLYCHEDTLISSKYIIKDSLVLYDNNTFEFYGHVLSLGGLEKSYSKGKYIENDSSIVLNSDKEFRRYYEISENRRNKNGTKYKLKSPISDKISIIEIWNKKSDTLFIDFLEDELISMNDSATGFILVVGSAYVGKYYFKNKKPRNVKILIDNQYENFFNLYYFEDEMLIKKDNNLIVKYFQRIDLYRKVSSNK